MALRVNSNRNNRPILSVETLINKCWGIISGFKPDTLLFVKYTAGSWCWLFILRREKLIRLILSVSLSVDLISTDQDKHNSLTLVDSDIWNYIRDWTLRGIRISCWTVRVLWESREGLVYVLGTERINFSKVTSHKDVEVASVNTLEISSIQEMMIISVTNFMSERMTNIGCLMMNLSFCSNNNIFFFFTISSRSALIISLNLFMIRIVMLMSFDCSNDATRGTEDPKESRKE